MSVTTSCFIEQLGRHSFTQALEEQIKDLYPVQPRQARKDPACEARSRPTLASAFSGNANLPDISIEEWEAYRTEYGVGASIMTSWIGTAYPDLITHTTIL